MRFNEKWHNGILALVDQMVVSFTSFVTLLLVAKECSQSDVGVFVLLWTIIHFAKTAQERMIGAPYQAFAYRGEFKRPSYRGSVIVHSLVFSLCLGVVAIIASVLMEAFGKIDLGANKFFFVLALVCVVFREQTRVVSTIDFQYVQILILDVALSACQILGLGILILNDRLTIGWANLVLGISCLPVISSWFWFNSNRLEFQWPQSLVDWKGNWTYSKWLILARMFGILPFLGMPWLIWAFLGSEDAGAYGVCSSLVGISLMFVNGVNNMFQPLTIREMHEKGLPAMLSTLFESILVVVSVLTVFSIAILFFSGEVLTIYGKQYPTYRLLCFLMSISVCCVSISTLLGNGLAALGVSKGYFWGEIACFTAAVVSACILLPLLGVNGAAIATTLGGVAATVVTAITLRFRIMGATSANILRE